MIVYKWGANTSQKRKATITVAFGFCDTPLKELMRPDAFGRFLLWLDDDDRIDVPLPVIFGGRVVRINQSYTVNQKSIAVLAGR